MPKVTVDIELSEEHHHEIAGEAERRRVTVQSLVQQMAQVLIDELEQEEREGTDHPILTS